MMKQQMKSLWQKSEEEEEEEEGKSYSHLLICSAIVKELIQLVDEFSERREVQYNVGEREGGKN